MLSRRLQAAVLAILLLACGIALPRAEEKLDINRASLAELEQLPGMTPAWAQRIIRFRPYRTKLDLVQEGIIPAKLYSKIRDGIIAHHDPR
jgi:competence protein ComEA